MTQLEIIVFVKELRSNEDRSRGVKWFFWCATENVVSSGKLLKRLVGAWGFEPQTPTVSIL
jgi:hypothetical protein